MKDNLTIPINVDKDIISLKKGSGYLPKCLVDVIRIYTLHFITIIERIELELNSNKLNSKMSTTLKCWLL